MKAEPSTRFIIDASFVLSFLLPDEDRSEVIQIFDQYTQGKIKLSAPDLLSYEIINGLKGAILRKRITVKEATYLVSQFLDLEIILSSVALSLVLDVAVTKELSIYDASYLYLAKKEDAELLTLDTKLKNLA